MIFTKFSVFDTMSRLVCNVVSKKTFFPNYNGKIIVGECVTNNDGKTIHVVRVWKNDNYFSIDDTPFAKRKHIGSLDYSTSGDKFKIEFLYVPDNEFGMDTVPKYVNASEYIKVMISIAERKAIELKNDSIIMDTHKSLRLFNRYYINEGFILTNKVASDHTAWVETKKKIEKTN